MPDRDLIVIVGGGHAGAQLCAALAAAGRARSVHLVCEEAELPYHRPPLSKSFLKDSAEPLQWHRAEKWFADAGITVHRADPAIAIDRSQRIVRLRSGAVLPYDTLVLATGARARRLPHLPETCPTWPRFARPPTPRACASCCNQSETDCGRRRLHRAGDRCDGTRSRQSRPGARIRTAASHARGIARSGRACVEDAPGPWHRRAAGRGRRRLRRLGRPPEGAGGRRRAARRRTHGAGHRGGAGARIGKRRGAALRERYRGRRAHAYVGP